MPPSVPSRAFPVLLLALSLAACAQTPHADPAPPLSGLSSAYTDPYAWLEVPDSPDALAWVDRQNQRTLTQLAQEAPLADFTATATTLAHEAATEDGGPGILPSGGAVDGKDPGVTTIDGVRHVYAGSNCFGTVDPDAPPPPVGADPVVYGRTCLVSLSRTGEDAVEVREYDPVAKAYVPGGFHLPYAKQTVVWLDHDTLLVARGWDAGEAALTRSGYPYVVKVVQRGQRLEDAHEIFRGRVTDTSVSPAIFRDRQGHRAIVLVRRPSYFTTEHYLVEGRRTLKLGLPPLSELAVLANGQLVVKLGQDWQTADGRTFPAGAYVSVDLDDARRDPARLKAAAVYLPGPREAVTNLVKAKSHLVVTSDENVRGRLTVLTRMGGAWKTIRVDLPDMSAISIKTSSEEKDQITVTVASFLAPQSLWSVDLDTGGATLTKAGSPGFDASPYTVDQWQAVSSDGTAIPYFIVHRKDVDLNGDNPTLLTAYGGFNLSRLPTYSATIGKLWLDRGGVYVVANIRGGGEFGPAWHDAALKTHRQKSFDDFTAVARDLIQRQVTRPARLGISGGSNGGLLMGVALTQHPDLWGAVAIKVPLLDMLRYEAIAAGASWVAEYGSVAVPEERAFLASISPYQRLDPTRTYPETLIMTATHDDRVGPGHARKFAARMEALGKPVLFYESDEGGHGTRGLDDAARARGPALELAYFAARLMPPRPEHPAGGQVVAGAGS
ncbi:prolyl oligopeptidase family serine peptidase [Nitrospirillum iridis]|uniref:Prolyl oligopeptidase n=1 Tax=Nitrospirillum iridis TaxID=765888 RepID=A0A7X0B0S8_9PROT|nr:prolyl oligopeptidase family serine peptidase [Nitrospirillum iridis]MBB6252261.1 prolyl oligopeptidase [Nitrospirillum iridis]